MGIKPTFVDIECAYCHKVFNVQLKYSYNRKYCSRQCSSLAFSKKVQANCKQCHTSLSLKPTDVRENGNYCSRPCYDTYLSIHGKPKKPPTIETKICPQCGSSFSGKPSYMKKKTTCSRTCGKQYFKKPSTKVLLSCTNCEKEFYRIPSVVKEKNYCSVECMGEHYSKEKLFTGVNSATYNGGKEEYYGADWQRTRKQVRRRENYTCQSCHKHESEFDLEHSVHHIIPYSLWTDKQKANELSNLMLLCEPCHRKIHTGDNHHTKFHITYKDFIESQLER